MHALGLLCSCVHRLSWNIIYLTSNSCLYLSLCLDPINQYNATLRSLRLWAHDFWTYLPVELYLGRPNMETCSV